jgi:site-specific DNA-cytosine methylase
MEWITIVGSKQANAYRGSVEDISPALTSAMGMGGGMTPMLTDATIQETLTHNFMEQERKQKIELPPELQGKKFRIRKLTPRECFRLMGVDDTDIDKMQASGLSNSAQYKLAGNSIVVDVLYHLFRKMFIETDQETQQLTLF